jgi:hypothetical protein
MKQQIELLHKWGWKPGKIAQVLNITRLEVDHVIACYHGHNHSHSHRL